jgi:hypothetical protein
MLTTPEKVAFLLLLVSGLRWRLKHTPAAELLRQAAVSLERLKSKNQVESRYNRSRSA